MGSVLDLYATLDIDTSGYEQGLQGATKQADGFSTAAVAMGSLVASAAQKAASALVGMAKDSVQTGINFDSAMSQVAATMGVSVDEIGNLEEAAKEMGSKTMFSATEAAEALNYLALAGYSSEQSIATLPSVLNLAAAGGMGLAQASDMVTDAMSALNLEADADGNNVTMFGDQLAKTASTTNTSVSQLGEAILTIGATGQSMKSGMKTLASGEKVATSATANLNAALGIMANVGIKGAEGGTHLRNIMLSLQSPTDDASTALKNLGVQIYDADGEMRNLNDILTDLNSGMEGMDEAAKNDYLGTIFNKTDLAAAQALIQSAGDEWSDLAYTIDNSGGAMDNMANTMQNNLGGALTTLSSATEGLQLAIYDKMSEPLTALVKFSTGVVQDFTDEINKPKSSLETFIEDIQKSNTELNTLLDNADKTVNGTTLDIATIESYRNIVRDLGGKTGLSATETWRLKDACEQLNAMLPGLGLTYDTTTGQIHGTVEEVDALIKKQEELLLQNAMQSAREDAYTALAETQVQLAEAETARGVASENLAAKMQELIPVYQDFVDVYGEDKGLEMFLASSADDYAEEVTALRQSQQAVEDLTATQEKAQEKIDLVDKTYENLSNTINGYGEDADEAVTATDELVEAIANSTGDMETDFSNWLSIVDSENSSTTSDMQSDWTSKMDSIASHVSSKMAEISQTLQRKIQAHIEVVTTQRSTVSSGMGGGGKTFAKAMDNAYILNGATVFGQMNGENLVGGEAGSEMVVGTSKMMGMISRASGNQEAASVFASCTDQIVGILGEYLPQLANQGVYIDGNALVGQISSQMDVSLGKVASRRAVNAV